MNSKYLTQMKQMMSLGREYEIKSVDSETYLTLALGDGFDVEIAGMLTANKKSKAIIYLWYGSFIVAVVNKVPKDKIGLACDALKNHSRDLFTDGFTQEIIDGTPYDVYEVKNLTYRQLMDL